MLVVIASGKMGFVFFWNDGVNETHQRLFFDKDSDKMLHSLQQSDGIYGAIPPYAQEMFKVSVICICKTSLIKEKSFYLVIKIISWLLVM